MLKTRKIMLTILTAIMLVCTALLGIIHINVNPTNALAESPTVTCQGIANDVNNNILEEGTPAKYRTLLAYDVALGSAANTTNVVSTTGEGVLLNGVKLSEISGASIDYGHGSRYIQIKIPQSYQDALTGDIIMEVVAGTTFENQVLDASKFILRAGKWVPYVEPSAVEFTGIQWNGLDYGQFGGKNGVLLQFSAHLSTVASEINGGIQSVNLASTIGEHIYLGGEKLSTLPGAFVVYHSQNFLFIYADNMTSFRTLTVEEGTVALDSILPEINLYYGVNQWSTTPINFTPVTFTGIQWNNIGYGDFQGKNGILLNYSANLSIIGSEYNGGLQLVNLVQTAIGKKIKIGGVALKDIEGAEINYHSLDKLWIYVPNMTSLGIITIEETNFMDVTLPKMGLAFNGSAWELCEVPDEPTVVCQGIANDMNNNILEEGSPAKYRTLLKYDLTLGTAANTTNVVSTTGEGIKLNGVKLSEIPDASIDYGHGKYYIQIKIPQSYQDALVGNIILEVVAGTKFENQVLDASQFILRNGMWVVYEEPDTVEFTGIQWNDIGFGIFEGKPGVLLSFDKNLSATQSEIDGGLQSTNLASSVGENIYLGGVKLSTLPGALVAYHSQNFMFVYADNMSSYRTLTVDEGTQICDSFLPRIDLYYGTSQWSTTPINYTNVTFTGIQWNNIGFGEFEGKNGVLLNFSANLSIIGSEFNGGLQLVNLAKTAIGAKIKLGDVALKDIEGAEINYHSLDKLWVYAPNMTTLGNIKIETTNFLDVTLPDLELAFNGSAWGEYIPPASATVVTQGIANDENNNILETVEQGNPVPRYRTLLKYDIALGTAANTTNVVSTTGEGILLNGVKLSDIPNASIDYGHGSKYIQIKIPQSYQDALTGDIILEVIAGTTFESQVLDASKFILRNGQWATYVEPELIEFATIFWNNVGHDVYEGKNGVLLSYSEYLSNVPKEVNGEIKTLNYVGTEIGEKIKLDGVALNDIDGAEIMYFGTSLLWIYAPNMDSYQELTIESAEFLVVILPETHFALFGSQWAESFKITHTVNGVEKVTYCKKNEKTVLGAEYYTTLFAEADLSVQLISFKVGDTLYGPEDTLTVNSDISVTVTVVGYETTEGAAVRLLTPTGIRFETKIDKASYDYLVQIYGEANIETGTYILPRNYLGLTPFDEYFADASNVDGEDYVKIVNDGFYNSKTAETDGFYKYYGSLVDLLPHNYCTEFFGIGYIKINDGANEYILYGGSEMNDYTRSIYEVSNLAYKDYASGTSANKALKGYIDGVVSLISGTQGIEIETDADGYTSPYSISYDGASGEYTVSGAGEIKSVMINGEKVTDGTNFVGLGEALYQLSDYSLVATAALSTVTFKLTPTVAAEDLVDFTIQMPTDRELKILQLTDTQIIDASQMRYPERLAAGQIQTWSRANIDKNCFNYITELIESERPDLIILTGDIIYGEFDDSGIIWKRMVEFMDSFDIPWAPIYGNHDNESTKGVAWQNAQLEAAENCLFKKGNVTGNGNYSIGLVDGSGKIRRVIYMLDSHGCIGLEAAGLAEDQIAWFKGVSNAVDAAYGEEVPAFACYHVPSLDFQTAYENKYGYQTDANFSLDGNGVDSDFGEKNENPSHFHVEIAEHLKEANVDGVFSGHDHTNNYSILYNGIRYTYGTKTGTYDRYKTTLLGGTWIRVATDGLFEITPKYLNQTAIENRQSSSMTVTFMSDIHFDSNDYGDFYCTKAETKLNYIVNETPGSNFYINLGDTVNSLPNAQLNNFYDAISAMKANNLNVYNSAGTGYTEGNRMMYNLAGNHEAAYVDKSVLKDYIPYVEGVGSAAVFKQGDVMFVAVDAIFTRSGSDTPEDILSCTEFTIPDAQINWLTAEVQKQMDSTVKGIVWISHIALQDIDAQSQGKLLGELKAYGLPMTVFEGHTHVEAYTELVDETTGEVYCKVYTLTAVTITNGYPYYTVTFVDGEVWYLDKHTTQTISVN